MLFNMDVIFKAFIVFILSLLFSKIPHRCLNVNVVQIDVSYMDSSRMFHFGRVCIRSLWTHLLDNHIVLTYKIIFFRHCVGETPKCFLNAFVK